MTVYKTLSAFICLLLISNCTTIRTENDTTPPTLSAWLFNVESDAVVYRSTDSEMNVTNNCSSSNGYFTELDNSTLEVGLLATDPGGIDKMSIEVSPVRVSDIRNVTAVNNPALIPSVSQTAALKVTISAEFSNRLTGQMIKFDVMGIDSVMIIDAEAFDLLLHRSTFVDGQTSYYPARVLHQGLCDD